MTSSDAETDFKPIIIIIIIIAVLKSSFGNYSNRKNAAMINDA